MPVRSVSRVGTSASLLGDASLLQRFCTRHGTGDMSLGAIGGGMPREPSLVPQVWVPRAP